jgi:hypothetical protein
VSRSGTRVREMGCEDEKWMERAHVMSSGGEFGVSGVWHRM